MKWLKIIVGLLLVAVMVAGSSLAYADEGDGGLDVGVVATSEGNIRLVVVTNSDGETLVVVNDNDFNDLATQQGVASAIAASKHHDNAASWDYHQIRWNRKWILEYGIPLLNLLAESQAGTIIVLGEQGDEITFQTARVDSAFSLIDQQGERLWAVEHHSLSSLEAEIIRTGEQAQTERALMESRYQLCIGVLAVILVFVTAGLGVALYRTKRINPEQKG